MELTEIDRNFEVQDTIVREGLVFRSARKRPMEISGIFWEDGCFRRMPRQIACGVSEGVRALHTNTAGGRVRFRTDSCRVAISARMDQIGKMPHFALTGSAGFDLYGRTEGEDWYLGTFVPPFGLRDGYDSVLELGERKMRELTIDFPLYSNVCDLRIGLEPEAVLEAPEPYGQELPILYYGSSITQGGCASRPGTCYQAILCRRLRRDYRNLGFSGAALAEDAMVAYLAEQPMSAFVMDYDHNAPDCAHLRATHEKLYRQIRETHPGIPIVLMARPKYDPTEEEQERLEIIRTTLRHAREAGDSRIWLLTGRELTALCGSEGTVDGIHPTDFGFASMASALGDLLEKIL